MNRLGLNRLPIFALIVFGTQSVFPATVIIGDYHTSGTKNLNGEENAKKNCGFGPKLQSLLLTLDKKTDTFASRGSYPAWFKTGQSTPCGYLEIHDGMEPVWIGPPDAQGKTNVLNHIAAVIKKAAGPCHFVDNMNCTKYSSTYPDKAHLHYPCEEGTKWAERLFNEDIGPYLRQTPSAAGATGITNTGFN